jgi:hypothetical protein
MNIRKSGQSFVEFAMVLPVIILVLLGVVELIFFLARYNDAYFLTREAARFASVRDPFPPASHGDLDCSTSNDFNFFYDTSCIFSPLSSSKTCNDPHFCNGFSSYYDLNLATDDILITNFTVRDHAVTSQYPADGPWALSDYDQDFAHNNNWQKDCHGNIDPSKTPFFTSQKVGDYLRSDANPVNGYVAIEAFICYPQVLGLPIITDIISNPIQIHVYTIMPLPAAKLPPTSMPPLDTPTAEYVQPTSTSIVYNTATPVISRTPTITATPTLTPTETLTPTITETPTPGPSLTPTSTATFTPTPLPTLTSTPTPTNSATPVPCSNLGWTIASWDPYSFKYSLSLSNYSFTETATVRILHAEWDSTAGSVKDLQTVVFGGSTLWAGSAASPFEAASSGANTWADQADLTMAARATKALTLVFTNTISMQSMWINVQIGPDPNNTCVLNPPPAQ